MTYLFFNFFERIVNWKDTCMRSCHVMHQCHLSPSSLKIVCGAILLVLFFFINTLCPFDLFYLTGDTYNCEKLLAVSPLDFKSHGINMEGCILRFSYHSVSGVSIPQVKLDSKLDPQRITRITFISSHATCRSSGISFEISACKLAIYEHSIYIFLFSGLWGYFILAWVNELNVWWKSIWE